MSRTLRPEIEVVSALKPLEAARHTPGVLTDRMIAGRPVDEIPMSDIAATLLRAFSGEVDTGSREENASKQKIRIRF